MVNHQRHVGCIVDQIKSNQIKSMYLSGGVFSIALNFMIIVEVPGTRIIVEVPCASFDAHETVGDVLTHSI